MKKIIKGILYTVIVVILLVIAAGFAIVKFVNPNDYKDKIETLVQEKTGRELSIDGQIELSLFPWIGVKVNDVSLANSAQFTQDSFFMQVGEANVKVKLMPLLSRKVEVGTITLKDMQLNLITNKAGQTNWQDLDKEQTQKSTSSSTSPTTTSKQNTTKAKSTKTESADYQFSINGINVENANISWRDQQKNQAIQLKNVQINSQNVGGNRMFPLNVAFTINSSQPDINGHFAFNSMIKADTANNDYQLQDLKVNFTPADQTAAFRLQAKQLATDLNQQTANISQLLLSSGNLKLDIPELTVKQMMDKPVYQGHLKLTATNIKQFLSSVGQKIVTKDPNALTHLAVDAQFSGSDNSLNLSSLKLGLDKTNLTGNINISNFTQPAMNFKLKVDQINLDNYLPPESKASNSKAKPAKTGTSASPSSTAQTQAQTTQNSSFEQASLNGQLQIGQLTIAQTQLSQIQLGFAMKNKVMHIDPLNANAYQGSMRGKLIADLRNKTPNFTLNQTFSNIDISQLLKSQKLDGKANVTANITMSGQDQKALLASLNGNTTFDIKNGTLAGKDIDYEAERAIAVFKKKPLPTKPKTDQTRFDVFKGTGTFTKGVFNNNDLFIQSKKFKATGNGSANLNTQALHYRLQFVGFDTVTDADGNTSHKEWHTPLPILITGTFDNPSIQPDVVAFLKSETGKQAVQKGLEHLKKKIGSGGASDAIQKGLQQLWN